LGAWGLGVGVLGMGPNPQSPIPNPQSPIPNFFLNFISVFKQINYNYLPYIAISKKCHYVVIVKQVLQNTNVLLAIIVFV
jgi:hypothetical protein